MTILEADKVSYFGARSEAGWSEELLREDMTCSKSFPLPIDWPSMRTSWIFAVQLRASFYVWLNC